MTEQEPKRLFWYRVRLLALIAVFLSPFVAGWMALYVFDLRPASGNYGSLVYPVRNLDWPRLESTDGRRFEAGFGRKWTFVIFSGEVCAEQCRTNLFYLRQIRVLLGRDTDRLQNLLISAGPLESDMREFLREYPDLIVIENYRERALYDQFQMQGSADVGSEPRMYLVDPDQNLMMHYPAENDQHRVLEDIRKLMKLSRIG